MTVILDINLFNFQCKFPHYLTTQVPFPEPDAEILERIWSCPFPNIKMIYGYTNEIYYA